MTSNQFTHIGDYLIHSKPFAKGSFSKIYIGKHRYSHLKVAIKKIKVKNARNLNKIVLREINIHSKLKHPNIIELIDVIINYEENHVYLILEYCELGTLKDFQNDQPFSEPIVQNFMKQIIEGLKYLHQQKIFHRDLKPQNILLNNNKVIKLTDFGLSREYNDNIPLDIDTTNNIPENLYNTFCGSPMYMSPELLHYKKYNSNSDIWSLGVIMFELITGKPPYHCKNFQQLIEKINEPVKLSASFENLISPSCLDLLYKLLERNPNLRITWEQLFHHPWVIEDQLLSYHNKLIENPLTCEILNLYPPISHKSNTSLTHNSTSIPKIQISNIKNIRFINENKGLSNCISNTNINTSIISNHVIKRNVSGDNLINLGSQIINTAQYSSNSSALQPNKSTQNIDNFDNLNILPKNNNNYHNLLDIPNNEFEEDQQLLLNLGDQNISVEDALGDELIMSKTKKNKSHETNLINLTDYEMLDLKNDKSTSPTNNTLDIDDNYFDITNSTEETGSDSVLNLKLKSSQLSDDFMQLDYTVTKPIPIPGNNHKARHDIDNKFSLDASEYITIRRNVKYISPNSPKPVSNISKIFNNSIQLLKDSFDYLSSNNKSV